MDELEKEAKTLFAAVNKLADDVGLRSIGKELKELRQKMAEPDFWSDNAKAQTTVKRESKLAALYNPISDLLDDAEFIEESAVTEIMKNDPKFRAEIEEQLQKTKKLYEQVRGSVRFNGPYDDHDVILNIYAGGGGTDAQDWAQMLLRMYTRWAENHKLNVETMDVSPGKEAGIKSATLRIHGGEHLYGKLAGEHGVHRLVRKSPFNAAGSRETSFARVDVLPEIDEPQELEIDDKDLKVDVFRASGHGGQSVNTTDSAVRITHVPTGITASVQNERSQLQNKEAAMTILRSRLAQLLQEQHAQTISDLKGPTKSAEFGNQIRSYVLDDRMVKDERSGFQSTETDKILSGDIDPLIEAYAEKY